MHAATVYKNNCIKRPTNDKKLLHDLHNQVTKNLKETMKVDLIGKKSDFLDFYDSIPDYDEINHLGNKEFYQKLADLKEQHREFCEYWKEELKYDTKETGWIEDYKKINPDLMRPSSTTTNDEHNKPSSRRSVRIDETPINITPEPIGQQLDCLSLETKSAPSTPKKDYDGITVPKPFQMTVRDEENQIVEELFLKINKPKRTKSAQFRANEVPIESQIPLFDKLVEEQQKRSEKVKEQRKAALHAQMRPFSFTKRDEEIQELTKQFSTSLPCVYNVEKPKTFRAKPVPKNLFSNYVYKKMHEDEFYRTLQKKIRAEEMLKHASLPPSMAKRETEQPKFDVCPRSYREEQVKMMKKKKKRKQKRLPNFQAYHDKYEKELEELKNEFISTSPRPFQLTTSKKYKKGRKFSNRISSATSSCKTQSSTSTTFDLSSINRSNLAAVLRYQSAKKRLEIEMMQKLDEAKLKDEARWREKVMRKKPIWQTLAYSHEDDLAMRLQLRRDEDRLRNDEHRMRMELMLGRVNQQPTLFERQSLIKLPKTKQQLIEKLKLDETEDILSEHSE